jgi:hypothetical protein
LVKHYENGEDSILKLYQHPWYEQNGKSWDHSSNIYWYE